MGACSMRGSTSATFAVFDSVEPACAAPESSLE